MDKIARRFAHRFFLGVSISALVLCPYSKVEESFQLQATHDLYYLGVFNLNDYDHLAFPGVVPRTFLGPLVLATICRAVTTILSPIVTLNPLQVQLLTRGILLLLGLQAWFRLAASVGKNRWKGTYLLLITAVQFHMPFYASRMLPNTFALILVLHSYADWFLGNFQRAAVLLVLCTGVFRCDVLLLLVTVGLSWLVQRKLSIVKSLRLGLVTALAALCVIVPLDSYFWKQYPLWAEGTVFYYNTVLGKSSNWGTSSWHWYMTSALPKAMLLTLFLVPLSILRIPEYLVQFFEKRPRPKSLLDSSMLEYLLPIVGFVGLYSCLGHKEMRFIFPAMPMLNLAAATGLERLHVLAFEQNTKDKKPSMLAKLMYAGALMCCFVTLLASLAFVAVSRHNYPGGTALELLVGHAEQYKVLEPHTIKVHVDVAAAMTGVSLFSQRAAGFDFSKAGYETENLVDGNDYSAFDFLLSETSDIPSFHVVATAQGHPRLDIRRFRIATEEAVYVLESDKWHGGLNP